MDRVPRDRRLPGFAALALVLALVMVAPPARAACRMPNDPVPVTLTITGGEAIDDAEGLGAGDPDLYFFVRLTSDLEEKTCTSPVAEGTRRVALDFRCSVQVGSPYDPVLIEIQLKDRDGNLGGDDTFLDLTPSDGRALNLSYDPKCDRVSEAEIGDYPRCPAGTVDDRCSGAVSHHVSGTTVDRGRADFTISGAGSVAREQGDLRVRNIQVVQVTRDAKAMIDDKPTMVRFDVDNQFEVAQAVTARAVATDETGQVFESWRTIPIPACGSQRFDMFPGGGFRPQAGPPTPPKNLVVQVTVDPNHAIEPDCPPPSCPNACYQANSRGTVERPIKNVEAPSVLFQPFFALNGSYPSSNGTFEDAQASRDSTAPYVAELYPLSAFQADVSAEPMGFDTIPFAPHITLAALDLPMWLLNAHSRTVGIVGRQFFRNHYAPTRWERISGASAGLFAPHVVIAESFTGAISAEVCAHELSHTYGLSEAPCPISFPESIFSCEDPYNWCPQDPFCPSTDSTPASGFRISTGERKDDTNGLMGSSAPDGGGKPDDWLDDADYNRLIDAFKTEEDPEVLWLRVHLARGRAGFFHEDDMSRAMGSPEWRAESAGGPSDPLAKSTSLVFRDGAGVRLDRVNFTPESVDSDGDGLDDAFSMPEGEAPETEIDMAMVVALPAGTKSIELVRREVLGGLVQESVVDTVVVPAEMVALDLLQPLSSVRVRPGDIVRIRWSYAPAATASRPRLAYVFVSPDNGVRWIPIAARVAGTEYAWTSHSTGRFLARVFATNGFNTDDGRGEADGDADGCGDLHDPAPTSPNPDTGDGNDGVANVCDNCPATFNPVQENADGDKYGDACDNCPAVVNDDQADADADGHGNVCDCAATDKNTWAVPDEVTAVDVDRSTAGADHARLSWASLAAQAGTSVKYDVVTGKVRELVADPGYAHATCAQNDTTATSIDLKQSWPLPVLPDGYWYLVRGQTPCGRGTFGHGTQTPDPRAPLNGSGGPCP